jgi:hypothetical protein
MPYPCDLYYVLGLAVILCNDVYKDRNRRTQFWNNAGR